jgi:hypothetical protein
MYLDFLLCPKVPGFGIEITSSPFGVAFFPVSGPMQRICLCKNLQRGAQYYVEKVRPYPNLQRGLYIRVWAYFFDIVLGHFEHSTGLYAAGMKIWCSESGGLFLDESAAYFHLQRKARLRTGSSKGDDGQMIRDL